MNNKPLLIERALALRSELFDIANGLAGNETGSSAVMLHEACNCILEAERKFKSNDKSIPDRLIRRSLGFGLGLDQEPSSLI